MTFSDVCMPLFCIVYIVIGYSQVLFIYLFILKPSFLNTKAVRIEPIKLAM